MITEGSMIGYRVCADLVVNRVLLAGQ